MHAETLTHCSHGLMSLSEDGVCKQYLPPQHCWHPRPGVEPVTLSLAANRATEAGAVSRGRFSI